ncbi:MAG: hypothetical protein KAT26_01250 [Marinosulfonomonas sp.]|nr:hypothetical protein [Marinosulfonomonas sp.]
MTKSIQEMAAQVADMMKDRLSIRGADLAGKLRHTGRMMPKHVKREAAFLAKAAALAQSPRLHKLIDNARVDIAYGTCVEFLETSDVADRRTGGVLGILASLTLSLGVVAALVIAVLAWRGFI